MAVNAPGAGVSGEPKLDRVEDTYYTGVVTRCPLWVYVGSIRYAALW